MMCCVIFISKTDFFYQRMARYLSLHFLITNISCISFYHLFI